VLQRRPDLPTWPLATRDALDLGVTPGQLAGPGWSSPLRGVHRPATAESAPSARQRILDVAELLPVGAAIGGWAAAHQLGADELDGRGWSGHEVEPVPVVLPPPLLIRHRPELVRWRSPLADEELVEVDGVPCTAEVRTGFDLVRTRDLRSGVVCLDILGRQIGLDPALVLAHAAARRRWKGRPRVAPAVALADPRALSTGETRLRLVWVLDAQLPRPEVNPTVRDATGFVLGIGDLLDPGSALLGEYDGEGHRELDQHVADNAREEWLEAAGLVVVRACGPDLWPSNRARTVARLHAGYRRGLGRDRSKDSWTWTPAAAPPLG
jgi:hypothetical protein